MLRAESKSPTKAEKHHEKERERIEKTEDEVAIGSDESFPASDPPSWTPVSGVTGEGKTRKEKHHHTPSDAS